MKRISILLVALLLGLGAPPASAPAQFAPTDVPPGLTEPDDGQDAAPFEEDTGLSTLQLVLMFGAAIAIVALIAWIIMRDAHRAAPATERGRSPEPTTAGTTGTPKKSAREREREKARRRSKAKHARDQRKRNRPR